MMLTLLTVLLAASPAVDDPVPAKNDRMVCKRDDATGSRMGGKRTCKKASEWARYYRNLDPNNRQIDVLGLRGSGTGQQGLPGTPMGAPGTPR